MTEEKFDKNKISGSKSGMLHRIAVPILVAVILIAVNIYLSYALVPATYSNLYYNHDMKEIAESGDDIDILFVGSSRVYRTFVPQVFEDEMGLNCVVNAATADATPIGIYYVLKDTIENYTVKRVFMSVSFSFLQTNNSGKANAIVYKRLSSKNKAEFFTKALVRDHGWMYIVPSFMFRSNLTNIAEVSSLREKAIENGYKAPEELYDNEEGYYADTGFIYSSHSIPTGNVGIHGALTFLKDDIGSSEYEYFTKSIELCMESNIDISLVIGPTTVMRTYNVKHYQDAVDYFQAVADDYGIALYNTNFLVGREEFLPDEMMYDWNHTNGEGAYIVSELFAEILKKADAGEDVSEYFYENLKAFKKDVHRIVAVNADIEFEKKIPGPAEIKFKSLQNKDVTPEYLVEIKLNSEEDYTTLSDWTTDTEIKVDIPYEKDYTIKVTARTGVEGEAVAYHIYEYQSGAFVSVEG